MDTLAVQKARRGHCAGATQTSKKWLTFAFLWFSLLATAGAQVARADATSCEMAGLWAAHYKIPLTWRGNAGLLGGEGSLEVFALVDQYVDELHPAYVPSEPNPPLRQSQRVCRRLAPATQTLGLFGGEQYASELHPSTFDSLLVAAPHNALHRSGQDGAQGAFESDPFAFVYGLDMDAPTTDPFPATAQEARASLRHGETGLRPGLALVPYDAAPYSLPPVNMRRTKRAASFDWVGRDILRAAASFAPGRCDRRAGQAHLVQAGGRPVSEAFVVGCQLTDGSDCVAQDVALINKYAPKFQPAPGEVTMVRLPAGALCPEVLAAFDR